MRFDFDILHLLISSHDESRAKIVIHRRDSFVMVAELIRFAN